MKKLIFGITLLSFNLFSNPKLCTAVRGNGEVIFAHWSSLARIVEHYGPIDKLAGGSSAAISIFLYESIEKNPTLSCKSLHPSCMKQRSLEISLLLKSLQGYFDYWITTKDIKAIGVLYSQAPELINKLKFWAKETEYKMNSGLGLIDLYKSVKKQAKVITSSKDLKRIINPELKRFINDAYTKLKATPFYQVKKLYKRVSILRYRLLEAVTSIKLVAAGGFDAKNDERLFFRPGIISFEDIAEKFGRIADFYSGYFYNEKALVPIWESYRERHQKEYLARFKSFLRQCSQNSEGRSWTQLAYKDIYEDKLSVCGRHFQQIVKLYRTQLMKDLKNKVSRKHRLDDIISDKVFPTTAILNDKESKNYLSIYKKYWKTTDKDFGLDWSVPYDSVKFAYWGNQKDLEKAKNELQSGEFRDLKKYQKMKILKKASWKTVLSLSPAEPGLSKLKLIPGTGTISIGGWSDLHPSPLLKSMGCENVIYLTRINGETVFGQGVVKRLFNLEVPSWSQIDPKGGDQTRKRNNNGLPEDTTSLWSQLYNIANPNSSLSKSIEAADAVWCTDWDTFNIKKGYTHMLDSAYNSKMYIKDSNIRHNFFTNSRFGLNPFSMKERILNKASHTFEKGWPSYSGCIPLN